MDLAEKYFKLFEGNKRAYGVVDLDDNTVGKKTGVYKIIKKAPEVSHWKDHLDGKQGLGVIPIMDDNTCLWGAIDVDNYQVDHKSLVQRLQKARIIGWVARSKSGGAHIYFFFKEPIKASLVKNKLAEIASGLGQAEGEVFPKQAEILVERGDTGNGLNMPYFKGKMSTRTVYDLKTIEILSAEEFVDKATKFKIKKHVFLDYKISDNVNNHLPEGPPCLQHLCSMGFGEGSRNNALFNLGVYARRFDADNWEELVQKYNLEYLKPSLSHAEVGAVIKQLQRKDYFFKCEDQPIKPFCNKEVCVTRKYGVGPNGIQNTMSALTKIDGDPPIWILNVDGQRLELSTDGLVSQTRFQKDCVSQINKLPRTVNQNSWQTRIQLLLDNLTIVEVPPDATIKGEFEDLLHSFCSERARGVDREDILQGNAVWMEGKVYFQVKDIKKHLSVNDFNHYSSSKITLRLQNIEADKMFWRVKGKGIHVWSLPQEYFESDDDPMKLPEIPKQEDVI